MGAGKFQVGEKVVGFASDVCCGCGCCCSSRSTVGGCRFRVVVVLPPNYLMMDGWVLGHTPQKVEV